jgi:hypothetical protein
MTETIFTPPEQQGGVYVKTIAVIMSLTIGG